MELFGEGEDGGEEDECLLGPERSDIEDMEVLNVRLAAAAAEKASGSSDKDGHAQPEQPQQAEEACADHDVEEQALRRFFNGPGGGAAAASSNEEVQLSPVLLSDKECADALDKWLPAAETSREACAEIANIARTACKCLLQILWFIITLLLLAASVNLLFDCKQ